MRNCIAASPLAQVTGRSLSPHYGDLEYFAQYTLVLFLTAVVDERVLLSKLWRWHFFLTGRHLEDVTTERTTSCQRLHISSEFFLPVSRCKLKQANFTGLSVTAWRSGRLTIGSGLPHIALARSLWGSNDCHPMSLLKTGKGNKWKPMKAWQVNPFACKGVTLLCSQLSDLDCNYPACQVAVHLRAALKLAQKRSELPLITLFPFFKRSLDVHKQHTLSCLQTSRRLYKPEFAFGFTGAMWLKQSGPSFFAH